MSEERGEVLWLQPILAFPEPAVVAKVLVVVETTMEEPSHPSETQAGQAVAFAAYIPREEGWDSTEVAYIAVDQACHFVWAE
jgi:hypothetical protein